MKEGKSILYFAYKYWYIKEQLKKIYTKKVD